VILVLPISNKDSGLALENLEWMTELDGPKVETVFVFSEDAPFDFGDVGTFRNVAGIIIPVGPVNKWPEAANWMFYWTAKAMEPLGKPFFWCEADAVPLRKGWFQEIEKEYNSCGKAFMGAVIRVPGHPPVMRGVAVYPPDTASRFASLHLDTASEAWDILDHDIVMPDMHETHLIQDFWGAEGEPPTFKAAREKGDPRNVLTLDQIDKRAVIFHRVKDSSLRRLLWLKRQ